MMGRPAKKVTTVNMTGALILGMLIWQTSAQADTLANIEAKTGKIELWTTDSESIAFLNMAAGSNDETLKHTALTVARAITGGGGQLKRVVVIFRDPSNASNLKSTAITVEQLTKPDEALVPSLSVVQGQQASTRVDLPGKADEGETRYQADRAKLLNRIQSMQAKGFNPKQVYLELAKVDSTFKTGDMYGARLGLNKVEKLAYKQEHASQAAVASETKARPADVGIPESDLFSNMSADEFHKKMEQQVLGRDLGGFIPGPGPLRLERYRIAKAIQYYQSKGRNIEGYRSGFKTIDDLAHESTLDKRKMPMLIDKVKYMLQQLGLPETINPNQ